MATEQSREDRQDNLVTELSYVVDAFVDESTCTTAEALLDAAVAVLRAWRRVDDDLEALQFPPRAG